MLSQAAAMFVALATSIAAQVSRFLVSFDEVRTFAGTPVPALDLLVHVLVVGVVLNHVLVWSVTGAGRTKVGVHGWSRAHRLWF